MPNRLIAVNAAARSIGFSGQRRPDGNILRIRAGDPLASGLLFYAYDNGYGGGVTSGVPDQALFELINDSQFYRFNVPYDFGPTVATLYGDAFYYNQDTAHTCPTPASVQAATAAGNYTFACAFIQTTGSPVQYARPFGRTANNGSSAPYTNWAFQINDGGGGATNISANVNNNGAQGSTGEGSFVNGAYTTAVGVLNGGTLTLYINGVASGTPKTGITPASDNTNDEIMFANSSSSGLSNEFEGVVFYGAFWGRPLSLDEVMSLHLNPYSFLTDARQDLAFPLYVPSIPVSTQQFMFGGMI